MSAEPPSPDIWTAILDALGAHGFVTAIGAFALGAVGKAVSDYYRSRVSLSGMVDERIKLIIESYEKRISELVDEVSKLEQKIDRLESNIRSCQADHCPLWGQRIS